jgi:hypothetical protein
MTCAVGLDLPSFSFIVEPEFLRRGILFGTMQELRAIVPNKAIFQLILTSSLIPRTTVNSYTNFSVVGTGSEKISDKRLEEMLDGDVEDLVSSDLVPRVIGEKINGGILRGMSMGVNEAGTGPVFSTPITTLAAARSQTQGGESFRPGQWWPNSTLKVVFYP